MSQEFVDAGDAVVALIRMKTKGRDSGIEANAKTPSGISFATARSRASTTTTTASKPSKPWGWRGRGYRGTHQVARAPGHHSRLIAFWCSRFATGAANR